MLLFPTEDHSSMRRNFMGEPSTEPWHGVILRDEIITFIERDSGEN
jgi:hypothetical protein